jgi:pilus assembly protein Flp/PilA
MAFIRRFLTDTDGVTAVEYAVMLAMILMACIVTIGALGVQNNSLWNNIRGQLTSVGFGS